MSGTKQAIALGSPNIIAEVEGGVGRITFNSPARRNAMSLSMWQALGEAAAALESHAEVRGLVMKGAGGKAFISGDDVTEFATLRSTPGQKDAYSAIVDNTFRTLGQLNKPLIAHVEGACIGGGLSVALAADLRFAVSGARFGIPAAKLGIGCEYNGVATMARLVGPSVAKDIYFTGRYLEAEEALEVGLINRVFEAKQAEAGLADYVDLMVRNAPLTLRGVKHAIRIFERYSTDPDAAEVSRLANACFQSEDYREGSRAFLEKRQPVFRGQ